MRKISASAKSSYSRHRPGCSAAHDTGTGELVMERILCTVAFIAIAYAVGHFGIVHLDGQLGSLIGSLKAAGVSS
jgi:hypothetical protein